jgi:hypothetical protein
LDPHDRSHHSHGLRDVSPPLVAPVAACLSNRVEGQSAGQWHGWRLLKAEPDS